MARNTQIENPTRVAIATAEDQNKYQIARNRNIDQTNQVLDHNVAADTGVVKSSNLLKLAEALRENSSVIGEYADRKQAELDEKLNAQAEQDALTMHLDKDAAIKYSEDKAKAYQKTFLAVTGAANATQDKKDTVLKYLNDPDKASVDITGLVSEQVAKNKGINNPYYLTSYNQTIKPVIEQLLTNQTQEKAEVFKEKSETLLATDLSSNNLSVQDIYSNGKSLSLDNRSIKKVIEKHLSDAAENGDFKRVNDLTKQLLDHTDATGFKPYGGDKNSFEKMGLLAMRNYGAKIETEAKVRDDILIQKESEQFQILIPTLMNEKDPTVIDKAIRDHSEEMIKQGKSIEEVNKTTRMLKEATVAKEPNPTQVDFENKLKYSLIYNSNALGRDPVEAVNSMVNQGLITKKQSPQIVDYVLQLKAREIAEAKSDAKREASQIRSENRQAANMERKMLTDTRRMILRSADSLGNDLQHRAISSMDDKTTTSLINFGGDKIANDLVKELGGASLNDINNEYLADKMKIAQESDPDKMKQMYDALGEKYSSRYSNAAIVANKALLHFNKDYLKTGQAKKLSLEWESAKLKGEKDEREWMVKNGRVKALVAMTYSKNRPAFEALQEIDAEKNKNKKNDKLKLEIKD